VIGKNAHNQVGTQLLGFIKDSNVPSVEQVKRTMDIDNLIRFLKIQMDVAFATYRALSAFGELHNPPRRRKEMAHTSVRRLVGLVSFAHCHNVVGGSGSKGCSIVIVSDLVTLGQQ
jgi:hypothetical protein